MCIMHTYYCTSNTKYNTNNNHNHTPISNSLLTPIHYSHPLPPQHPSPPSLLPPPSPPSLSPLPPPPSPPRLAGANLLCKYLGEYGDECGVTGAVSFSNPYDLEAACAVRRQGLFLPLSSPLTRALSPPPSQPPGKNIKVFVQAALRS